MSDQSSKPDPYPNNRLTEQPESSFDFASFPPNSCFHERRKGQKNPVRKERRKRIDPTTFERVYDKDQIEFMNAIQRFKERTKKSFPTYGEVLQVARALGYRKVGPTTELPGIPAEREDEPFD